MEFLALIWRVSVQSLLDMFILNMNYLCQVCDKIQYPILISIFGNLSWAIAFAFIGPLPFIEIQPEVSIIQVIHMHYSDIF